MGKIGVFVFFILITFIGASEQEFPECPSISDGYPPVCICRYGPEYDNTTNTCPNPECPPASVADSSYPNCKCTEMNFDYSEYVNECFRVCPENSSGYWPKCICDDKLTGFDKKKFKCVRCPEDSDEGSIYPDCSCKKIGQYNKDLNECTKCGQGSTGTYPNCVCNDENAIFDDYNNNCVSCPPRSKGKVPNCVCDNGAEYYAQTNYCRDCPYGIAGVYPDCDCGDGVFDEYYCKYCPWKSNGTYGNCICEGNGVYMKKENECFICPFDSTETYPSCTCKEPSKYDKETNSCLECPENSIGTFPKCECKNGFFLAEYSACIECPEYSTGTYPDCECEMEGHIFTPYLNKCYIECGTGSSGLHPFCTCDASRMYYDSAEFTCKSNFGRDCPLTSIGIGPDCLCIKENEKFFEYSWRCYPMAPFGEPPNNCPDKNQKWPQCSGIDRNALLSLIG